MRKYHLQCNAREMKGLITPLCVTAFLIFKNGILDPMFSSIAHGAHSWISIHWMDLGLGADLWNQDHGEFFRFPSEFCALI